MVIAGPESAAGVRAADDGLAVPETVTPTAGRRGRGSLVHSRRRPPGTVTTERYGAAWPGGPESARNADCE